MPNEVRFTISGRDQGGKKAIDQTRQSVRELLTSSSLAGSVTSDVFQNMGRSAQRFLGQAAAAASNLQQSVGGTEAVFGAAAGAINDFAKQSAQATGLSEASFRDATTLIGGQLKRMTGDVDLAAESSIELVKVGADLAATYGGTTKEAVDAFAAALRGEADPAERFNLNLKISAVNAKAVELGLAESTDAVDDNARAQALLALVMEQSADAQGQFAREADTAAVSQQKAQAAWEDASAQLGNVLLPVMAKGAEAASRLLSVFQALPGPTQAFLGIVVILSATFLALAPRIMAAKVAMDSMGLSMRQVATRGGGTIAALTAVLTVVSLLDTNSSKASGNVAGLSEDLERLVRTGRATAELKDRFGEGAEGIEEFADKLDVATAGFFDWSDHLNRSFGEIDEAKGAFKDLDQALAQLVEQGADADELFKSLTDTYDLNEQQVEKLKKVLPEFQDAQERANEATQESADTGKESADAWREATENLQAYMDKLREHVDPVFAFVKAQEEVKDAQKAVNEAEEEFGEGSSQWKQAVLDLAEANLGLGSAASEASEAADDQLIPALKQMRDDGLISKQEFRLLRDAIRNAGREAERWDGTRVRLEQELVTRYTTIGQPPRTFGAGHLEGNAHGGITGAQGGGPRGGPTLVNEQGPELARFPSGDIVSLPLGTTVIPAGQSQAMLANGNGGGPQHLIFDFRGTAGNPLAQMFVAMFREALRNNPTLRAEVRAA